MSHSRYTIKNSVYFIGMILLTQLLVYLLDANWSVFMKDSTPTDVYFHINYIVQLRFSLLFAYGLVLIFKVISTIRTLKLKPIYVIPQGAKVQPIKANHNLALVYSVLVGILVFTYFRASDKPEFFLSVLSGMITALAPLWILTNSSVFLYNDCVKIKDKVYMGYDLSEVLEAEDDDSMQASFQFKYINDRYTLSVPMEHRNALHAQLLHYAQVNKPRYDEI